MKKLRIIGNIIFFSLVVYFIGQSVNVFLGKKAMQTSLVNTSNEIKELENRKSKLLDQEKNSDENEKNEKYARNNLNLKKEEIAYMGDDLNDIKIMKMAGFCGTPLDGANELKEFADFISTKNGGDGAVREFIETILKKENLFQKFLENVE